jgi:hypothetical protein
VTQWTIDPRHVPSGPVCDKAIRLYEATPRVIVRTSRRGYRVPSWTRPHVTYPVVIVAAPDGWKVTCGCDSTHWCHHGYAAALTLAADDNLTIPEPRKVTAARKTRRGCPLTVIPGGRT